MSSTWLFIAIVMIIGVNADPIPQFNPFAFVNQFVPPFNHFNNFNNFAVPSPPFDPFNNFANMYTQFGNAKGFTKDGGVVQATKIGLGGNNYQGTMMSTVTGPDGKPVTTVIENNNGIVTKKEVTGEPQKFDSGFGGTSMIQMSSVGFNGGNYEKQVIRYHTKPNGETVAKIYTNKDGKEEEKEITM